MRHLSMVALWPLINYLNLNYGKISGHTEILIISVISLLSVFLYAYSLKKLFKFSFEKSLASILVLCVFFFFYGDIVAFIGAKLSSLLNLLIFI